MKPLVTLKFNNIDANLLNQFPVDKDSDITLLINGKETFQLTTVLLKSRSKYFETQLNGTDSKFKVIQNKYDAAVFQKILHCIYGYQYHIYKDSELYSAYQISHFLQINKFIEELQECISENIEKINFLYIFTIAEQLEVEYLKERIMEYLDQNPQLWKSLLPISKLENFKLNFFQNNENKSNSYIPDNILLLQEDIFRKLIILHNEYKGKTSFRQYYLYTDDIFKIIQYYVKTRFLNQEDRKKNTMRLIKEIFILQEIWHDTEARILNNFLAKSLQSDSGFIESDRQIMQTIEQQKEREQQEQIIQVFSKYLIETEKVELENRQLRERVKILCQQLENLKIQPPNQNGQLKESIPDEKFETSEFVNDQQAVSIPFMSLNESKDNSFYRNSLNFDSTPCSVFSTSELTYLWDILNVKIFQQIRFTLLYRGQQIHLSIRTENNFCLTSEKQLDLINQANSIVILIRSIENNSVFGIFKENIKIQIINFQAKKRVEYKKELKISINQSYLLKLGNDIEIFVDCCNRSDNICNNINGLGCLAGKQHFQVDELEIYQCSVHNEIV